MNSLKENIRDFDHIGIPCWDIEETIRWYTEYLGFEAVHEPAVETDEGTVKVAFLKRGDFILEFYQLLGADYAEVKNRSDGHIDHFALEVTDINTAFAQATELGLNPMEDAPVHLDFWENGIAYFKVRGPSREVVEFIQKL